MSKLLQIFCCLCLFIAGTINAYAQSVESTLLHARKLYEQYNYTEAQEIFLKALQIAEGKNNPEAMATAQKNIAACYYYMRDGSAALKWFYKYLHTVETYRLDTFLSNAFYLIGALYIEAENVDSAEKYSLRAAMLMREEKDYAHLSQTYATLAQLYMETSGDTMKMKRMIKNAEEYADLAQSKIMAAFAATKRFVYCFDIKKDYRQALYYINIAEKLYTETGNREAILNTYSGKAQCLIMLRDTAALSYYKKWLTFKDSVWQNDKAINIAKYETLYETEKKESENKLLQERNEQSRLILLIVIIVFLLFVVIALWLFNRNNLKKKKHELLMLKTLQEDKERIARDLHDNVGGQLSYIIYSLDGINDEDKEKRHELTGSINQAVKSVIVSLRETIWAISDANINMQDFSDKLKVFARDLFKHSNTTINFTERIDFNRELNALLGLNLYRICQEILNNAFKYAAATKVKIEVQCDETKLLIMICDNGIGFDATQEEGKERYGLRNIKKRADEFGILLSWKTGMKLGTKYELLV